jgi:hypothetical protein
MAKWKKDKPVVVPKPVVKPTNEPQAKLSEKPQEKSVLDRIADRPHSISIALSILALLISLLSWWESHSGRVSTQTSNRAVVEVVELRELAADNSRPNAPRYKLIVKNSGRSSVVDVLTSNTILVSPYRPGKRDYPEDIYVEMVDNIPPNSQKEYEETFVRGLRDQRLPELKQNEHLFLIGVINYMDEPSGVRYLQRWCFQLDGADHTTPIRPCPSYFG